MNVDGLISLGGLGQAPVSLSPASNKDGAELLPSANFGSVPEYAGISKTNLQACDETVRRSFTPPQAGTTEHNGFATT